MIFESKLQIMENTWQAFERNLSRLLMYEGYSEPRVVGQSGDHGADVIANKFGKRWLFQAKRWKKPVDTAVVQDTIKALQFYKADIPVIVSSNGFTNDVISSQPKLIANGIKLQLWDSNTLISKSRKLENKHVNIRVPRSYQESAIREIVSAYTLNARKAMIVMATGLGKTFVAAESIRRIRSFSKVPILVCAHMNDLVYQLEKSFWPFLSPSEMTLIWNSNERPTYKQLENADYVFACIASVSTWLQAGNELPEFGIILIDECHHVGASQYERLFNATDAGQLGGPFALGLTATPFRADEIDLKTYFGTPRITIDMIRGLKEGFLTNVDYRMYTDNIDWKALENLNGNSYTPKQINRTFFIQEWDDAVVYELAKAWKEQAKPQVLVFCGNIEHALIMRDKLNALGFCKAAAVYSNSSDSIYEPQTQFQRNQILSDFSDGRINVVCAVDIFNEGIDVPDVNILVFQRVTHSRRIFIQQLGRGLRIAPDKDKVIVLDFVSDIRRFAAGISLKDAIKPKKQAYTPRITINNKVTFRRVGGEDPKAESFLRQWLEDVAAIEAADDNASVLKFPPKYDGDR